MRTCQMLFVAGSAAISLLAGSAQQAAGQSGGRLTIGIGAGWIGGASLWDVAAQPILSVDQSSDIFHLHRDIGSGITFTGHGTFMVNPHVGVTGEFTFLGLGGDDSCTLVQDGGDAGLREACAALPFSFNSASTTALQAGVMLLPLATGPIRPYGKLLAGVALTPSSTVGMRSLYGQADVLTIYNDEPTHAIRPTWTAGAGVTVNGHGGYQVFAEFRETSAQLSEVTGPTTAQGFLPPYRNVRKIFPSIYLGLDIVLENMRRRHN